MIGKLKGVLSEISGNIGLIETKGGVYYEVYLTPSIISKTQPKTLIEVYTYLQVREDALTLFGFQARSEYEFFKMLLSVSGVGPKTAFSVISYVPSDQLVSYVKSNDAEAFS